MTVPKELADYLARHPETRFVDAVLFDLCGTAIGKRLPVREAEKLWSAGVAFCAGITTLDALGACWDVTGIGFSDGDPDATCFPIPGTLAPVPWAGAPTACIFTPRWWMTRAAMSLTRPRPRVIAWVIACWAMPLPGCR